MRAVSGVGARRMLVVGLVVAALAVATALVALLEQALGLRNTSSVYLLAVATVAIRAGTIPAVATAAGAFLIYNLLFVEPRFTFGVARTEEWVTLLLLLFVGVVIGRLAGRQRDRERLATRREREARALFSVTRELATAQSSAHAISAVLERLVAESGMARMWVGLGPTALQERTVADTDPAFPRASVGAHFVLRRDRAEGSAAWIRINPGTDAGGRQQSTRPQARGTGLSTYRVEVRSADELIGSLWSQREMSAREPYVEQTRLLAVAADQVGQAVHRERLATAAAETEIARRSDELRSALLDSVSHDLRTPLASIRAAAGTLADPSVELRPDERRAAAESIDQEAEGLNRLVGSLLDMSRIQGGVLVPDLELIPLRELVEPVIARSRAALGERPFTVDLPAELPSVRVDAMLLTQALINLLENAGRHVPRNAPVAVRARRVEGAVELVVEDGGPGVPPEYLEHLFERFSRYPSGGSAARRGLGLGLAVVRGFVEAMHGSVRAERSKLGGLAVALLLPLGAETPGEVGES